MKIVIIGGGIVGAALARYLTKANADVTLIESGAGATEASFGWVNASYFLNEDHFRLRSAGLAAWRALDVPLSWSGALCWDAQGAAFEAQHAALTKLGYAVEEIEADQFRRLEPHVVPPERALRYAAEGVAEPQATTRMLLQGIQRISGVRVIGVQTASGRVTGVETTAGAIAADRVIVAAGTGSAALLQSVDVALPMLERPAVMVRTAPVLPLLSHVLVTPEGEVRQDADGHIWAPASVGHQADARTKIEGTPEALADAALARVKALLPETDLRWEQVMLAQRPMPGDELPVIGAAGPEGLFVAVMHSGVTLAAIVAQLLGPQVLDQPLGNAAASLAAPYSIDRFQSAMS